MGIELKRKTKLFKGTNYLEYCRLYGFTYHYIDIEFLSHVYLDLSYDLVRKRSSWDP